MSQLTKYSPGSLRASGTPQFAPVIDCTPAETPVPIGEYLAIVRRQLWKIAPFVFFCTLGTYFVSSHLKPTYEATAVIDVDRFAPRDIVGEQLNRGADINDTDQFLLTQVKLIHSSSVLRPVVEKYRLLEREHAGQVIKPQDLQRELAGPIVLRALKVKRQPETYLILVSYRSSDPVVAANVANAIANSYIRHTFDIRVHSSAGLSSFMEKQLEELKAKMERSAHALARYQSEFDVIDPAEKTNILSSRLQQLNTEYTNAQVDRVRKESIFNSIQSGSLEGAQISGQGEALVRLMEQLNEASQHFAEIKTTYGSGHPEYQKAASRVSELEDQVTKTRKSIFQRVALDYKAAVAREHMLQKALAEAKAEFDSLNSRSFEYQRLLQEAAADKKVYEELASKIKEADINAGFQNNNIRIADLALPPLRPVFPITILNVLAAFILSSLLAATAVVIAQRTNTTLRTAEETTRFLDTRFIGALPFTKELSRGLLIRDARVSGPHSVSTCANGAGRARSGECARMSPFEEAIRMVRNSILLSNFSQNIHSVLITSAGPGEGKTTTAVHLAIAHSSQGRRTLLIDADLRRPVIDKVLHLSSQSGLSDVLMGDRTWREARISVPDQPYLDVILAGTPARPAADLVGPMLNELLDEFVTEYDLIILDSSPFIGFAEALQAATAVDGIVVVASCAKTSRRAIELTLASMSWLHTNVLGIVLNRTRDSDRNYGYYAYYRDGHRRWEILKNRTIRTSRES